MDHTAGIACHGLVANGVGIDFAPDSVGAGNHAIVYIFADAQGCTSSDSTLVQVDSAPPAANAGADATLFLADEWPLTGNATAVGQGVWTIVNGGGTLENANLPGTVLSGIPSGETMVRWTLLNGQCSSSDVLLLVRNPFEEARGFSPNNDGTNDTFVIEGLDRYPNSKLQVLSRWGDVVFETLNYQNDWTGANQSGEALPDDTYFFILDVSNGNQFKGYVELRR